MVVKSSYTAIMASMSMTILYLVLGSGTVRSLSSMPELIYHLSYIVQPSYSGALLNGLEFYNKTSLVNLSWRNETTGVVTQCKRRHRQTAQHRKRTPATSTAHAYARSNAGVS